MRSSVGKLAVAAAVLVLVAGYGFANPFLSNQPPVDPPDISGTGRLAESIADLQLRLSDGLADFITSAEGAPLLAVLIAAAYGFFHALGPGHRKTVLLTYFGTQPSTLSVAVAVGLAVAALHGVSTVSVTYGAYYLVRTSVMLTSSATISVLQAVSYGFVAAAGGFLLVMALRDWLGGGHSHGPADETQEGHASHRHDRPRRKGPAAVVVSALAPCPGASMVALLCLSVGKPLFGVAAVFAMSVGTAFVTVPIAAAATLGRSGVVDKLPKHRAIQEILHHGLETAGGAILLAFGLLMVYPHLAAYILA